MVDLETWGKRPGSIIVAIGAVKFGDGQILAEFYERVDPESCERLGMRMDVDTIRFWMKQSDEARLEIIQPGAGLPEVLARFTTWLGDPEVEIWGNGATFDNVMLSEAYQHAGLPVPWKYKNDRCYRTVSNLHPDRPFTRGIGIHHNALDDARTQAMHLMTLIPPAFSGPSTLQNSP